MKKSTLFILCILYSLTGFAQDQIPPYLKGKISYPAIKTHPFEGVIQTDVEAMEYDPTLEYKIVIDVYDQVKDSSAIHVPITQVARVYNLNMAYGVPKEKLKMAVVIHGSGIRSIFTNEKYRDRYGLDNPNLETIRQLKELGVKFYVCGQNLGLMNLPRTDIITEVEVALSAKTTFITLDQRGYTYMNLNED